MTKSLKSKAITFFIIGAFSLAAVDAAVAKGKKRPPKFPTTTKECYKEFGKNSESRFFCRLI